jgi:septum formation protein
MDPIILASGSPRRQDFFRLMGLPFTCIPAMIDETPPPGLNPQQAAEELAQRKALAVANRPHSSTPTPHSLLPTPQSSPPWVFAADTIVVLENDIFGKPTDRDDARRMLERLAGRRHEVITAMALYNGRLKTTDSRSKTSEVAFAPLAGAEIEWYLDTGEWEGAAGAYRLQGLGACLIEAVNGSPSGVAGLPLYDFYAMLRDNGYLYPYGRW